MIAHINIGSNIGNRAEHINRAVLLLGRKLGRVLAISGAFDSEAWGYESKNRFLNIGVNVDTEVECEVIVAELKKIERIIDPEGCHRDDAGSYVDRVIDLDLICLESMVVETPSVVVPHPRMHMREFVLIPMTEILPEWHHPELGLTPSKLLANLYNKKRTERV